MYRTTLSKLYELLESCGCDVAVTELKERNLKQEDINIIEVELETDVEEGETPFVADFNIFTKSGTVLFGERIECFGDFSIHWTPCHPKRIYEVLQ